MLKHLFVFVTVLSLSLQAQYYDNYFGTNKVQYTHFQWNILETEHFEIYYYPEMRELAERAGGLAEEQYAELQSRFNHALIKKVPMIIYSSHMHFQQTNTISAELPEGIGGFFEFFKGRVVLPSDGSTTHFRRVLRHELVHVFMNSKVNRIISQHRKFNHPGPPLWFTEGLAEYWSGQPDFQAEMVIRDATLNGTLLPVQEFWRIDGSYYMYKLGENFLHFLTENYGEEKILQLMENIWKFDEFQKVVTHTVGKNYETLSQEWLYWLKKKYYPTLSQSDMPFAISQTITKVGFSSKPAYLFDGTNEEIFFVANRDGYTNIYRQNLKETKATVFIEGERTHEFEAFHFFKSKIHVNEQGQIAFATKSGERDVLYVYNTQTGKKEHQYTYKDLTGIISPHWAPDGKSIVFSGLHMSGNSDLYTVHVSTDETDGILTRITNDFYDDRDPAWSPDGKYITFSSDRAGFSPEGTYNLFIYDLETARTFQLTNGKYQDASPAWSPKGDYIVFTSNGQGSPTNISVVPFIYQGQSFIETAARGELQDSMYAHYAPRQLTDLTSAVFDPIWTKDGDLVMTAFEDFSFKLRRMEKAYDKARQLVPTERKKIDGFRYPWTTPKVSIIAGNTRSYEKKYSLDFVQGAFQIAPTYGYGGGATIGYTDMLGDDQYYLTVFNTGQTTSDILTDWNFILTKVNLGQRVKYAYGGYRFKGEFNQIGDQGLPESVFEDRYGGFFQVAYPLSKFERIETGISVSRYQRGGSFGSLLPLDGVSIGNNIGYVYDNALWGITGPIDGHRAMLSLGYTSDAYKSQQNFYTIIADYRHYFRITMRSAYAFRAMTQWNDGKNPSNFVVGGSWDLRGFPRWNMPGTRFFVMNHELRFPLMDAIQLKFPFVGLGFRSIRGAIFTDIGNAWGVQKTDGRVILGHQKFDGFLGSVGTGFRVNLLGVMVLRFDFGKMFDARGYKFGKIRLPGNRDRFVETKLNTNKRSEGFGGIDNDGSIIEKRRWSRGIFFQFWFGADF